MNEKIQTLVNALEKNGEKGTILTTDDMEVGIIEEEDKKEKSQLLFIDMVNKTIHLRTRLELDHQGINELCSIIRKNQSKMAGYDSSSNMKESNDERVNNGIYLCNASNLSITELHEDKKNIGLMLVNENMKQGFICGLGKEQITGLISVLQDRLKEIQ